MRKTVIDSEPAANRLDGTGETPLDVESVASVEVSSEDPQYPVENVFSGAPTEGWRAAVGGPQTLRLLFDQPVAIRRVALEFHETRIARTQEFALRAKDLNGNVREAVRQQWNFSPQGSTVEVEDLHVSLAGVVELELVIKPEIGGGAAVASLRRWSMY